MQHWDVSVTELGRELHVGMTGGGREFFFQIYRPSCWMLLSERGLINTESTAASEWVILIQQHYHPAITLLIQPETSSDELMCLFPWIIWGHDLSLKSPECTGTFSAKHHPHKTRHHHLLMLNVRYSLGSFWCIIITSTMNLWVITALRSPIIFLNSVL